MTEPRPTAFPRSTASRGVAAALAAAVLALAGCATAPDPADTEAVAEFNETNDPVEPTNRAVFELNLALDKVILKPIATAYRDFTPDPFQESIYNALNNLRTPVILANDLLQGELARGGVTLARFAINSTLGLAGLFDVASGLGFEYHNEDFGQTLAVWGVPEGPYVMLPIFGPSNPRDTVGIVVDILLDPIFWWSNNTDREFIPLTISGVRAVDARSRNIDLIDELERSSLDFYAAVRSLYRQRRIDEISNGKSSGNFPAPGISMDLDAPGLDEYDGEEVSRAK